jgi:hypothetical protein
MKYAIFISLLFAPIFMLSCSKCSCLNEGIPGEVVFKNLNSASAAYATIAAYAQGSNFSTPVSWNIAVITNTTLSINNGGITYTFIPDYDYLITISPIGNIYKITNLGFTNSSTTVIGTGGCDEVICTDALIYTINDTNYNLQTLPGPDTAIIIK